MRPPFKKNEHGIKQNVNDFKTLFQSNQDSLSKNYFSEDCTEGKYQWKWLAKQRNKGIGLEIPAIYSFYHKKPSKIKKLIELLKDKKEKLCKQL